MQDVAPQTICLVDFTPLTYLAETVALTFRLSADAAHGLDRNQKLWRGCSKPTTLRPINSGRIAMRWAIPTLPRTSASPPKKQADQMGDDVDVVQ